MDLEFLSEWNVEEVSGLEIVEGQTLEDSLITMASLGFCPCLEPTTLRGNSPWRIPLCHLAFLLPLAWMCLVGCGGRYYIKGPGKSKTGGELSFQKSKGMRERFLQRQSLARWSHVWNRKDSDGQTGKTDKGAQIVLPRDLSLASENALQGLTIRSFFTLGRCFFYSGPFP